jgi:hydrogenase-4 membrane subunit HyfE
MKTFLALVSIAAFTSVVGYVLVLSGIEAHHQEPLWAIGTSIIFLVTLLIDVWMFFAIAGEEAYQWEK